MSSTEKKAVSIWQKLTASQNPFFAWIVLLLLVLVYLGKAWLYLPRPIAPDAALIYLPYAKRLLAEGMAFLRTPESVYVPPISYFWPALFGGEVATVKMANMLCGILMLLLVYGIGKRAHSRNAGLVAALLFAASPFLISWIPTPLSEPPFFLFTLIWLWGVGEALAGRRWAIPVAAIGLTLSILTRSIWLYPSILLLVGVTVLYMVRPASRSLVMPLILVQAVALIVPLAVIVKNMLLFGLPAIDTGTGGALFYGANIITDGFEPPLLGMNYEDGGNSRSLLGNKEHARVAMQFLAERSVGEIIEWYLHKISWIVLFTKLEAPMSWSVWRIAELSLAIAGLWWAIRQKSLFTQLLAAGVAIQVLQTGLVLYNIRYSIDNVELLLVPLAAIGLAAIFNELVAKFRMARDMLTLRNHAGIAAFGKLAGSGYWILAAAMYLLLQGALRSRELPMIHIPHQVPVSALLEYKTVPGQAVSVMRKVVTPEAATVFELEIPKVIPSADVSNMFWQINIAIAHAPDKRCTKAMLRFTDVEGKGGVAYFDVRDDGSSRDYNIGTAYMYAGLFPAKPGKMALAIDCASDNDIRVNKIALIAPQFVERYFKK